MNDLAPSAIASADATARPRLGAVADVTRALLLVGLLTGWNQLSDIVSDHLHIDTGSFASPWKFPLILFGTLVTCGGIVGLGCVVWGRRSLRALGWTFERPGLLVGVGLGQLAVLIGMVVAAYRVLLGPAGVGELGRALAAITPGQRLFFAVMGIKIAFLEETLFRGDLLRTLTPRIGKLAAVVISSALFALFHRSLALPPLTLKFLMGLILASSASRLGSLLPSALAHALLWATVCDN